MKPRSLTASLGWGLSVVLALLMALQWLLVTRTIAHITRGYVLSRLEHDAESLTAALETGPDGLLLLDPQRVNPTFARPFSGHYYQLRLGGHTKPELELASASLWTDTLTQRELPAGGRFERIAAGPRGQSLLILQLALRKEAHLIQLSVAEDLSPLLQTLERFSLGYALASALLLALLLALQRWLIGRLLAPLRRTQADLDRIATDPDARLQEPVLLELQPLVRGFNQLLALQQERLIRQRNRLGDLSHALKRPLSRMLQLIEARSGDAAGHCHEGPWPELAQSVNEMDAIIRHQLSQARLAGSSPSMAPLELRSLLGELVKALEKLYADKALTLRLELAPDLKLRMDRQDALELFGNVLENACKWARTTVEIRGRSGLELEIHDDGPGVPAEMLEQLSQRGLRADQQIPGHGLGLAIVKDLVQAYGGRLSLKASERLGGFQVSLQLPEDPGRAC